MKNFFIYLIFISNLLFAQKLTVNNNTSIKLWSNNKIPDGTGPSGEPIISNKGSLINISIPKINVYSPEKTNGIGILIIAGGGYAHIELGKESNPTAKWLKSLGITVFELEYRLPQENWKSTIVPFQDAQRAMRIIRSKANEFNLDVNKIGILGFSAGGHLASYLSSTYSTNFYNPIDKIDSISAKPNFSILIYPIISMLPPNNKTHSFKSILGENPTKENEIKFSVEKQVNSKTPITFIAQAVDDPISPIDNSILMFNALKENHIDVEMHLFQNGGHGWGLGKKRD